jgi:fermentation-respiration switch protein FrsA (DUF1100 family)
MKRTVWIALRITLLLIAAMFLFAQFVRRTGMFFPERYPEGMWDTHLSTPQADVTFRTDDGVRLHGWLFRAAGSAPLMIWFHGNGGNITERAPLAAELARRGVSVLLFDWRGYGKSEGSPSESALYHDALAAYDFAVHDLHPASIALYGESLGGPYAAYVATKRKAACVVIENSFPSLRELGNAIYRPIPIGWFAPFAMSTARWLNEAGLPVLVMHGRRDQVIPFALGASLYDQLRGPKQFFASDVAGHCEIPILDSARYYDNVVRFVQKQPEPKPAPAPGL